MRKRISAIAADGPKSARQTLKANIEIKIWFQFFLHMRIQVISNLNVGVYSENATFDAQSNLLRAILAKLAAAEGKEYFLQRSLTSSFHRA
jgi:hypothetical protein